MSFSALVKRFVILICGFLAAVTFLSGCGKKGAVANWPPHYRKAVEAYRRGDFEEALSLFQKAFLYDPSNFEIYLDIAAIYDNFLGDPAKAVSYYDKYLRHAGNADKAGWVRRWMEKARRRLAAAKGQEQPAQAKAETPSDKDQLIHSLRDQLHAATQALAEEKDKTASLSKQVSGLYASLSAALKQRKELQTRLAAYSGGTPRQTGAKPRRHLSAARRESPAEPTRWISVAWLLCLALGIVVLALLIKQRYASAKQRTLLESIQVAASGSTEHIRKDDILGKYFWVENDRSAGILSFTEKDGEIHACAIDGTTRLRSRGRGKLVGNVLTAELRSGGGEGVLTKFIFANKGRTVTAVWQGDQGTSVAAGTKGVED